MGSEFESAFSEAARLLDRFRTDQGVLATLEEIGEQLLLAFRSGHKVLVCGNGGSMADAMHFAEEWTGRFKSDRPPYPVIALSDPTHMSCVANDYGFDHVFSRLVQALGQKNDLLFILSTTGNSPNLVNAAEAAKDKGVSVVGFLGRDGGIVGPLCDTKLMAPGESSDRIQELHMLALHALIDVVERKLAP